MHRLFKNHLTCLHFISAKQNQYSSVILVTRFRVGRLWSRGSIPYRCTECFLPRFILAVGSPQPPIQRLLGGLWAINPNNHLHLVSWWRMHGGTPPFLASSWHVVSLSARRTLLEHSVTVIVPLLTIRPIDVLYGVYGAVQKRVSKFCEGGRNLNVSPLIVADHVSEQSHNWLIWHPRQEHKIVLPPILLS
jgi:hypothetical protein